jgi:arylsulfatase A-like enzyme
MVILMLLWASELAHGLWDWRRSGQGGFGWVAVYSAIFLSFFWVTLFLFGSSFSQFLGWLENKTNFWVGLPGRLLVALVVCLVWNILIISVAMSFSLGTFVNLSMLRFAATNFQHGFFEHLTVSQRWISVALMVFLVISTLVILWKAFVNATRLNLLASPKSRKAWLYVWLLLFVGITWSLVRLNDEQARNFKNRMINHLCYKLDPLLSFGLNCFDFYRQSKYENMPLDESGLTPRSVAFSQPANAMRDKPNIIFLQIESLRGDLIGQVQQGIEIVPHINRLAKSGTLFSKGYAASSYTRLSSPSIPSSLYPLRRNLLVAYRTNDPWPKTLIYDVLKPYGYATTYIASDIESWCGMDEFLSTSNLDVFVDSSSRMRQEMRLHPEQNQDEKVHLTLVPDNITMRTAIEWMDGKIDVKQPFYATISLSDSHFPYKSSNPNAKWFQPCGVPESTAFNGYSKAIREQVRNSYLNAIHGVDQQIGRLLDFLHDRGVDDHTIIVVYGDHGESFYESDLHTRPSLPYETSIHTCLIMSGKGYFPVQTEDYPASLIDAVPTVLARLGLRAQPNFQGIDLLATNRPPSERRCVYFHMDGIVNADGLLAAGRWKYFEDNGKGDTYLFDLAHDCDETNNLVESQPGIAGQLSAQLSSWRTTQLTYYRSPRYYTQFYPPPPQMLKDKLLQ